MRVLLIWEEVPETTKFFLIPDPSAEELAHLKAAHGALINTVTTAEQNRALGFLNEALCNPKYASDEGANLPVFSKWFKYQYPMKGLPEMGPVDQVFWAGFVL